jgi:thioredoxin reductase (NADPH)
VEELLDIAVIGAGPCGLSTGVAAKQAGLRCALFERRCLTSTIERYPTLMTFFSTADKVELGGLPFITAADKPTRLDALKYYRRVAGHFQLDVRQYEEVVAVDREHGGFTLGIQRADGSAYGARAAHVVIATGYFDNPNLLGVPGEELPKVFHYFREGHPFWRQDCLVVGAGNSAVDAALELYRTGARVTLVHFADTLDAGVKPWVLPDITNRLGAGDIRARWRTRLLEVRPRSVVLQAEGGRPEEVPNDWVFAMTGYRPDHRFLRALGVEVDGRTGIPVHDPATMQTTVPGLFLAGVVAAGYDANKIFIENGREHGTRIVRSVLQNGRGVG